MCRHSWCNTGAGMCPAIWIYVQQYMQAGHATTPPSMEPHLLPAAFKLGGFALFCGIFQVGGLHPLQDKLQVGCHACVLWIAANNTGWAKARAINMKSMMRNGPATEAQCSTVLSPNPLLRHAAFCNCSPPHTCKDLMTLRYASDRTVYLPISTILIGSFNASHLQQE